MSPKIKGVSSCCELTPCFYWCLERESNSHGRKAHEILSLGCLPIPPSRQVRCFYHNMNNIVNHDGMIKSELLLAKKKNFLRAVYYVFLGIKNYALAVNLCIAFLSIPRQSRHWRICWIKFSLCLFRASPAGWDILGELL